MGGTSRVPRRVLAVGLYTLGLYLIAVSAGAGVPSLVAGSFMLWDYIWPNASGDPMTWEPVAIAWVSAVYFLTTGLSGVCAQLAAGSLWWDGSPLAARLFAGAGALGSFGQALPGLLAGAAAAWNSGARGGAVVVALWSATPSLVFVILAACTVVVLGGERYRVGSVPSAREDHED